MDQKDRQGVSIRNVRTFARDAARVQSAAPTTVTPAPTQPVVSIPTTALRPSAPTLQEKINAHSAEALRDTVATKASHLSDNENIFDVSGNVKGSPEGTIVKDTRKKQWSLSREIEHSVSGWVKDKAESLTAKKESHVAPAAFRADIIATAGAKSHIAPHDDSRRVVQKLRTFAKDAERATGKPFALTTDVPEEAPQWTSISDPSRGQSTKVESAVSNVFRSLKQGRQVRTAPLENRGNVIAKSSRIAVAPQAAQTLPDTVFQKDIEERAAHAEHQEPGVRYERVIAEDPTIPTPVPRAETPATMPPVAPSTPEEAAPQRLSRDETFEVPTFADAKTSSVRTFRSDAIEDVERKNLSVVRIASAEARRRTATNADIDLRPRVSKFPLVVGAFGVIFALALGAGVFTMVTRTPAETPADVVRIPSFIATASQHAIPLGSDRDALLSSLGTAGDTSARGSLIQLYPTIERDGKTIPATTGDIMSVLDVRAPGSFVRSLEDSMMIGAHAGEARRPFIILKTTQFETAYAGMLEWEQSMSADLAPLFGEPVRRTLDPTARTNDQTRTARFVDDTIRNRDIRILYNEVGEERMLYSFIDQNTIIITTAPETFVTILEHLR